MTTPICGLSRTRLICWWQRGGSRPSLAVFVAIALRRKTRHEKGLKRLSGRRGKTYRSRLRAEGPPLVSIDATRVLEIRIKAAASRLQLA
jgi:hypothetical protein